MGRWKLAPEPLPWLPPCQVELGWPMWGSLPGVSHTPLRLTPRRLTPCSFGSHSALGGTSDALPPRPSALGGREDRRSSLPKKEAEGSLPSLGEAPSGSGFGRTRGPRSFPRCRTPAGFMWPWVPPVCLAVGSPSLRVGAGFMPVAFRQGCPACFWVESRRKRNCTKGSWWEGPASRGGPGAPGKHHAPSSVCWGPGGLPARLVPPSRPRTLPFSSPMSALSLTGPRSQLRQPLPHDESSQVASSLALRARDPSEAASGWRDLVLSPALSSAAHSRRARHGSCIDQRTVCPLLVSTCLSGSLRQGPFPPPVSRPCSPLTPVLATSGSGPARPPLPLRLHSGDACARLPRQQWGQYRHKRGRG